MILIFAQEFLNKRIHTLSLYAIAFIFSIQSSQAQSYIPMLDSPKEWHLTSCFSGCLTDVYYINSDTVVQGLNYKVLDGFHYISRTFLFREELSNQKVFLSYPAGNKGNEEVVLYDFSLSPGDTFSMNNPITPFPATGGDFILDSLVSKMLLDGLNHRFYYFSPSANNPNNLYPVWVEGLGSLSLINAPGGTPDVMGAGKVSCFFANGNLVYSQLDSVEACVLSGLNIAEAQTAKISIYPTLVDETVTIEGLAKNEDVSIFNNRGEFISKTDLRDIKSEIYHLNLTHLPKGLYYLKFSSSLQQKTSIKFIKR